MLILSCLRLEYSFICGVNQLQYVYFEVACFYLVIIVFLNSKVYFLFALISMSGLDVVRTDRTLVYYEKQENLSKLWDILAVYAWIDTDVGYCQGGLFKWTFNALSRAY
jgi:hypothetical protein